MLANHYVKVCSLIQNHVAYLFRMTVSDTSVSAEAGTLSSAEPGSGAGGFQDQDISSSAAEIAPVTSSGGDGGNVTDALTSIQQQQQHLSTITVSSTYAQSTVCHMPSISCRFIK